MHFNKSTQFISWGFLVQRQKSTFGSAYLFEFKYNVGQWNYEISEVLLIMQVSLSFIKGQRRWKKADKLLSSFPTFWVLSFSSRLLAAVCWEQLFTTCRTGFMSCSVLACMNIHCRLYPWARHSISSSFKDAAVGQPLCGGSRWKKKKVTPGITDLSL